MAGTLKHYIQCHAVRLESFSLLLLISGQVKGKLLLSVPNRDLNCIIQCLCACWMLQNDF